MKDLPLPQYDYKSAEWQMGLSCLYEM